MNNLQLANDAGRSAIAALKAMRNGDPETAVLLVAGLDPAELGALTGACLAIASAALSTCDQLSEELSRATGKPAARGDDILRLLLLAHSRDDFLAPVADDWPDARLGTFHATDTHSPRTANATQAAQFPHAITSSVQDCPRPGKRD